jgi:uncharacterized protein (TIGR03790 family)
MKTQTKAAVDNELTLVLAGPYQIAQWLPNPFLTVYDRLPFIKGLRSTTLMVGRLDGPTPEIAQRLVDDALAVEQNGLKGTFYIDARGLPDKSGSDAYARFDARLRHLYEIITNQTSMPVVLDDKPDVFAQGSCPQAALYCGWYSLAKYVDAFTWVKGAVAYHVASAECATLHHYGSNVWCKRLLDKGVAATWARWRTHLTLSCPDEFFLPQRPLPLQKSISAQSPIFLAAGHVGDPLYNLPGRPPQVSK